MKTARWILTLIVIVAIVAPAMVFRFLPTPDNLPTDAQEYRIATTAVVLFAWLHIGSVLLFLAGLQGFKEEFRRAYKAICLGLALYGISLLQFPIIAALNLWQSAWSTNGGKAIPLIAANIMLFIGLRLFAKQLNIQSWTQSFWLLAIAPVAAALFSLLAEDARRLEFVADVLCLGLAVICAPLVWQILRATGKAYKNSLRWLAIVLTVNIVAQFLPPLIIALRATEGAYITLPFAIAGIVSVVAGYSFTKIGISLTMEESSEAGNAKALNLLIYLASLASSPKAIDPIMDNVRFITARSSVDAPLSENDQKQLVVVYNRLIAYLINQDPLRVYDKPLLDRKIRKKFQHTDPAEAVFWNSIA